MEPNESSESTKINDMDLFAAKPTVDDGDFGSVYPIVTWINGMPGKKGQGGLAYEGGFFIDAEQGLAVPGATPYTHITNSGKEVEGFMIRDFTVTPIRMRKCFRVDVSDNVESTFMQAFAAGDWDEAVAKGKPRGVTHLLCVAKGMTDPIVVVWTGQSGARVSAGGNKPGIMAEFGNKIVMRARHLARKAGHDISYPRCAFSLTIGPDGARKGKKFEPNFTEVGRKEKSQITLPVWLDKPEGAATEENIGHLFVGNTTLGHYEELYRSGESWYTAWSSDALRARRGDAPATTPTNGAPADGLPADEEVPF